VMEGHGRHILEPAALGVYVGYAAAKYAYSPREILGRCPCTASVERSGLLRRMIDPSKRLVRTGLSTLPFCLPCLFWLASA
jgi:hypothetical protein